MSDLQEFFHDRHFDSESIGSAWRYMHCKRCGCAVGKQSDLLQRHIDWHREQDGEIVERGWKPGDIALWTYDVSCDPTPVFRVCDPDDLSHRWVTVDSWTAGHFSAPQVFPSPSDLVRGLIVSSEQS